METMNGGFSEHATKTSFITSAATIRDSGLRLWQVHLHRRYITQWARVEFPTTRDGGMQTNSPSRREAAKQTESTPRRDVTMGSPDTKKVERRPRDRGRGIRPSPYPEPGLRRPGSERESQPLGRREETASRPSSVQRSRDEDSGPSLPNPQPAR